MRKSPSTESVFSRRSRHALEQLEARQLLSTAHPSYVVPVAAGVEVTPILTVGDAVPTNDPTDADGLYRMVGIPDGLGAYDNGDGTFTVLMNHELASNLGVTRDHGAAGSFVSKWVIRKSDLEVLSGDDLIKTVYVWDPAAGEYVVGTGAIAALNRLCSADLPELTAFYNPRTGRGTQAHIFMNGEESSNGRAFAHVVTGAEAGTTWELPWAGRYAWENHVASPFAQDKTVVMGLDDSRREFSSEGATEPSEVYVWVGQKQRRGTAVERAGLVDGILHGLRVGRTGAYDANESTVRSGERFELVELSDQTSNTTFLPLQAESIQKSITQFRRVEDGHFDPNDPDVFYFVTTDIFGGQTRLWKLTFDDIRRPERGGVIEIAVDSPAGVPGEMFDNMTVNGNSDVLLQEDPGNNPYLARIWQFDSSSDDLIELAQHNPAIFGVPPADLYPDDQYPQYPGPQTTNDEESSGIIDVSHILGEGKYLLDVQAHFRFGALDPELVEAGQFLLLDTSAPSAEVVDGVLEVNGTVNDDQIGISRRGDRIFVSVNDEAVGSFSRSEIDSIHVFGGPGDDVLRVDGDVRVPVDFDGGPGNDRLRSGGDDNDDDDDDRD